MPINRRLTYLKWLASAAGVLMLVIVSLMLSGYHVETLEFDSVEEFFTYTNNPSNGLVRTRNVKGVEFRVRYLPTGSFVHRQLQANALKDSIGLTDLKNMYSHSIGFQLEFGADGQYTQGDITYMGVQDYEEYADRVKSINFGLEELIELHVDGKVYSPKIALAENTYSLSNSRKVLIMFSDRELTKSMQHANESVFVFVDRIFGTGVQKYRFDCEAIRSVPEFPYQTLTQSTQ